MPCSGANAFVRTDVTVREVGAAAAVVLDAAEQAAAGRLRLEEVAQAERVVPPPTSVLGFALRGS